MASTNTTNLTPSLPIPLEPTSAVHTATLSSVTGVPGWQIQRGGHLSAVTMDDGNVGTSLVGFGAPPATTGTVGDGIRTNSEPVTHTLSRQALNIVIIVSALTGVILICFLTAIYFLRRNRRRRLQSFNRRTSELKRQSTIHHIRPMPAKY